MSGRPFEAIHAALCYTTASPPTVDKPRNKIWEVLGMMQAWNNNMVSIFKASWASCLNVSMSIWFNQWTCPVFFCPRKLHPYGNEYHTIFCAICGIMYRFELVMGKDSPFWASNDSTNAKGNTVGLLLRLCKSLYSTGKFYLKLILFYFYLTHKAK